MVSLFDYSEKGWVSGKGRKAEWRELDWGHKQFEPQYLMGRVAYFENYPGSGNKIGLLAVGSGTNTRSLYCAVLPDFPCGNSVAVLRVSDLQKALLLQGEMASFRFDFVVRMRLTGVNLNYFVIDEAPLPQSRAERGLVAVSKRLSLSGREFSDRWLTSAAPSLAWRSMWAVTEAERLRNRAIADAVSFAEVSFSLANATHILKGCDHPQGATTTSVDSKGFWRVDKDKDPELRHTVLALVAFADLEEQIRNAGDRQEGIEAFLNQNDGDGWILPESLRLADYGLGHDERAKHPQPVATCLGPRFYDWQLAQTAEESWRECEIHAKNLQATGVLSSGGVPPADTTIDKRRVPARGKRRRQEEKGLLALDGLEDEPA